VSDKSSLDGLTIEELEELLEAKRRARGVEHLRRVAAGEERKPRSIGSGSVAPGIRSSGQRTEPGRGKRGAGRYSSPSAPHGASTGDEPGKEEMAFKAVKITPLTGLSENAGSFLAKVTRSFWHRGFPRLRDRLLLLLELAALAGLILVVFSSLSNLQILNREVAEALESEQIATPATSMTPVAVLPGSSFPPDSEDRVPDPYRHLVEPGTSIPIPTPGPRQASRIVIPAIGVDAPVVEGDGWEELKMGAGHHIGSANPGERSNMVISGHDDVYGEIFRNLEDLNIGDEVIVYAGDTPYHYVAVGKRIVEPDEVSLLEPTPNATVTLITCYPYLIDTHRLVVIAELANQ
jgi:sortase A